MIAGACRCGLERREESVPAAVADEGEEDVLVGSEREKQQLALSREVT